MKKLAGCLIIMAFVHCSLSAQTPGRPFLQDIRRFQRPDTISVVRDSQIVRERVTAASAFQLRQDEMKAVVVTGDSLTRLDKSVTLIKDTVTGTGVKMIPELYFAREAGTERQVMYRITFVDSAPLKYDSTGKTFKGAIRYLAVDANLAEGTQPEQVKLSSGEDIIISYGSTRVPVVINEINWPPRDVDIISPSPLDSLLIKILTISKPDGYSKYLPVEPLIFLSGKRHKIQGFGLQTMPVYVSLKGVSSYKPISVAVEPSAGSVKPSVLTLTDNTPKEIILRTEGHGRINLNVTNSNYLSNSISVNVVIPWLFLILAIIGGMIGGAGKKLKGKGKITIRFILYCAIIGLMVAVAYWGLGVNLLKISFEDRGYNEAMVFGVALIAGFFGTKKV